jgi:hypothetical protein
MDVNMRFLGYLMASFLIAVLSGCSSMAENAKYTYTPPVSKQGKHCVMQCSVGKNSCEQLCMIKHPRCAANARRDAEQKYNQYQQDQLERGLPVRKHLQDFIQINDCKRECHCRSAYNVCYSACGGSVYG